MKIIGFAQLRNEDEKGNLKNWVRCMEFCDYVYIVDQNSTDNSRQIYEENKNFVVTYNESNEFRNELKCKSLLLDKLLKEHPDVDWIFWMDGDTILDQRLMNDSFAEIKRILSDPEATGAQAVSLGHINLWRSDTYGRLDDEYDSLSLAGVNCFWRNTGNLKFPDQEGLHKETYPQGIELQTVKRQDYFLIHKGFSTTEQIYERYNLYKKLGQSENSLSRLINEFGLKVQKVSPSIIPDFSINNDVDPRDLPSLIYGSICTVGSLK